MRFCLSAKPPDLKGSSNYSGQHGMNNADISIASLLTCWHTGCSVDRCVQCDLARRTADARVAERLLAESYWWFSKFWCRYFGPWSRFGWERASMRHPWILCLSRAQNDEWNSPSRFPACQCSTSDSTYLVHEFHAPPKIGHLILQHRQSDLVGHLIAGDLPTVSIQNPIEATRPSQGCHRTSESG